MSVSEQAVQAAHAEFWKVSGDNITCMRAALTAALPFLTGVKVKKLDWVKPPLSETLSRCETEFGTYRMWTHDEANGKWFWSVEGGYNEVGGSAKDEAAAKAAAQSDYEARILSAIDVAPSPRAQALEEAAQVAEDYVQYDVADAIRLLSSQPVAEKPWYLTMPERDPFAAGFEARQAGADEDDNPFEHATDNARDWDNGWESADDEAEQNTSHPVADGWLPIETAPKDGKPVILAVPTEDKDRFIVGEAYFDPKNYEGGDWWWAGTSHTEHFDSPISEINHNAPTHWRPLPASPGASE